MLGWLQWLLAGMMVLAPALATSPAKADTSEPIRIQFQADAGCPDAAAFIREVRGRTARARVASPEESARSFDVLIVRASSGVQGRLVIQEEARGSRNPSSSDAGSSVREVSGRDCAEVVSALALIAALAIDPKASTATDPPPLPVDPPAPQPEPPRPPPVPHPGVAVVRAPPADPAPWPPLAAPLPAWLDPDWGYDPVRYRVTTGVHLAGVGAVAPGISSGIQVFTDFAHNGDGAWAPAWRISIARIAQAGLETASGNAAIRWIAGRAQVCPVRLGSDEVGARPCAFFEIGAREAQGVRSVVRPWAALGLLGRVHWVIEDRIQVEGEGGLSVPSFRDSFSFDGELVHATPSVGGIVSAGLGLRFP